MASYEMIITQLKGYYNSFNKENKNCQPGTREAFKAKRKLVVAQILCLRGHNIIKDDIWREFGFNKVPNYR